MYFLGITLPCSRVIQLKSYLLSLLKREKGRQIRLAIGAAVLLSIVLLSVSLGVDRLRPAGTTDFPDDLSLDYQLTGDGYVLGLNNYMDQKYIDNEIVKFTIHGNLTTAVHPNLISSEVLRPDITDNWIVNALIVKSLPFDMGIQLSFQFSTNAISSMHSSFLEAMELTTEIDAPDLSDPSGSVPELLMYTVYYEDQTGLQFTWLGLEDQDVLAIEEIEWDETGQKTKTLPAGSEFEFVPTKYISPKTAFEPFLEQIKDLYKEPIDNSLSS